MNTNDLIRAARGAAERAYAPYSGFRVGAAVVDSEGRVTLGTNVENSAYGSSICAEANAVAAAVAAGARKLEVVAVSCIDAEEAGYPCGNCRQIMVEFGVERVLVDGPGGPLEHSLEELISHPFRFVR